MELPTLDALNEILNELLTAPDDEDKAAAIAKVKAQIEALRARGES